MKKFLYIFALVLALEAFGVAGALGGGALHAQPAPSWSISFADGTVTIEADVPEGAHIYDFRGYTPTTISFNLPSGVSLSGNTRITTPVHTENMFGQEVGLLEGLVRFEQDLSFERGFESGEVTADVEWAMCKGKNCFPPDETTLRVFVEASGAGAAGSAGSGAGADGAGAGVPWSLLLSAVLWGFAMLLTPCVFPMVPMTVSYFVKRTDHAKLYAAFYGLFIVALYTLPIAIIILITYISGGESVSADIFNFLATHWIPNLIFFVVFMVFAASFFGAFEIELPSSLVNSADSKSGKKGLAGVFFMALTLVLVSFSCTGPIVGTVLIESTSGGIWSPIFTMLAFSIAFALPFTVLAFAPSLLKRLPKSGGWLASVKVVLGFIELALGFKFLSVADQTYHWGILDREIYLALWIVIFSLLGLYLLGKIRFKGEEPLEHLSVPRLGLAITVLTFVVYMIPGMWGAPLKGLSGYLPPIETQDFVLSGYAASAPKADVEKSDSYDKGLEQAAASGKLLFLEFTGIGCVNCREMEQRVFTDPEVQKILSERYVQVALWGDDKSELPSDQWVTTSSGRVLKTVGKVNSHFMRERFGVNAQPYYIIIDPTSGETLDSRAYNLDIEAFKEFLRK